MPPNGASGLAHVAYAYALSFLLLSPVSLFCYAFGAPLWVFSAALCGLVLWSCVGLYRCCARALAGALRPSVDWLAYGLIAALLGLQLRTGGWLDGDATVHLGKIRVLLQHGFTNRDIYLAEYRFHHAYHSNLLLPVYASSALLTGQSALVTWFYTETWAKLLVAAGHYVLGETLTGLRSAGFLLASTLLVLNAGETYALYPNVLCLGFLLPMLLALGISRLSAGPSDVLRSACSMGALAFVVAQIHVLYVVYAALVLGPLLSAAALWPGAFRARKPCLVALLSMSTALPFVLVSGFAFRDARALSSAPQDAKPPEVPVATPAGTAEPSPARARVPEALAAGGGHLEKVLDIDAAGQLVFKPERMGGTPFLLGGFAGLALATALYAGRRRQLLAAMLAALWLACILFYPPLTTRFSDLLQGRFVVARLSSVLTTLSVFGVCAASAWCVERLSRGRAGVIARALAYLAVPAAATSLLGHAPVSFREHVAAALAPVERREARLHMLLERSALLAEHVPAGRTVLTTARFARQVVMLCDCYVLAADRGHTHVVGIDKRRRDLVFLNAADTPWEARAQLLRHYGVRLVTFENRWRKRYAWAYRHGRVLGSAAGQDVILLNLP